MLHPFNFTEAIQIRRDFKIKVFNKKKYSICPRELMRGKIKNLSFVHCKNDKYGMTFILNTRKLYF
jgi:hypothetical protein